MKVKVKIIQTDIYEKEMIFDIDIEVSNDKQNNEYQAREKINDIISEECIDLAGLKNAFVTGNTDIEFIEWNVNTDSEPYEDPTPYTQTEEDAH